VSDIETQKKGEKVRTPRPGDNDIAMTSFPFHNEPETQAGIKLSGDSNMSVFLFFYSPEELRSFSRSYPGNKPTRLRQILASQEIEHHHIPGT